MTDSGYIRVKSHRISVDSVLHGTVVALSESSTPVLIGYWRDWARRGIPIYVPLPGTSNVWRSLTASSSSPTMSDRIELRPALPFSEEQWYINLPYSTDVAELRYMLRDRLLTRIQRDTLMAATTLYEYAMANLNSMSEEFLTLAVKDYNDVTAKFGPRN